MCSIFDHGQVESRGGVAGRGTAHLERGGIADRQVVYDDESGLGERDWSFPRRQTVEP
jgi:hypothetical protein